VGTINLKSSLRKRILRIPLPPPPRKRNKHIRSVILFHDILLPFLRAHNHPLFDETDRRILLELRKNCRRSYRELSKALDLSPATLIERVKRLEKAGYILGYSANLDFLKLGYEFMGVVKIDISRGALLEVQGKISKLRLLHWDMFCKNFQK